MVLVLVLAPLTVVLLSLLLLLCCFCPFSCPCSPLADTHVRPPPPDCIFPRSQPSSLSPHHDNLPLDLGATLYLGRVGRLDGGYTVWPGS